MHKSEEASIRDRVNGSVSFSDLVVYDPETFARHRLFVHVHIFDSVLRNLSDLMVPRVIKCEITLCLL